jgi:hypothetical protein
MCTVLPGPVLAATHQVGYVGALPPGAVSDPETGCRMGLAR